MQDGRFVLVDNIDADLLMFTWTGNAQDYVTGTMFSRRTQLHVEIARRMGITSGRKNQVDHASRNKLDCRRENLRASTPMQNGANSGLDARNKSGFKGVSRYRAGNCWQASIRVEGKSRHLGHFEDPSEAARAYDEAAKKAFGVFAHLNFPPQVS